MPGEPEFHARNRSWIFFFLEMKAFFYLWYKSNKLFPYVTDKNICHNPIIILTLNTVGYRVDYFIAYNSNSNSSLLSNLALLGLVLDYTDTDTLTTQ